MLAGLGFVAFLGTFLTMVSLTPTAAAATIPVQRIYGTDAIGTSIAVSHAEFPAAGSAQAVVLARSDFFSDALSGGPLAAKLGGPLLITPGASLSTSLDPRVQAEIQRVLPVGRTVYILGGDLALSPNIDATLEGLGYTVVREAGADEYATAVDIAEQLGNPTTIFEATGLNFPDALSAVPAAIATNGAILLTDGTTQATETAAYLAAHSSDFRDAIGGPLAAAGADPAAHAVYGQDLYGTSAAVASTFFPKTMTFGAATGTNFPDALSGGVFMGAPATNGPVLLVQPSGPLPPAITSYLSGVAPTLTQGYLFGGPLAVGADVLSELEAPQSTQPPTPLLAFSPNWSGYVVGNGPFTSVTGTFSVPHLVSGTPIGDALSEWVGIDGSGNSSLIQAGIHESVDPNNLNLFDIQAWWEILPEFPTDVPIANVVVAASDEVTVTIGQISGSEWGITLTDDTNGESFTTDQTYTGPGASAEWILEAPEASGTVTPLPPYSPAVTFNDLRFVGTQATLTDVVMLQAGVQVSTPSPLTSDGFNVAYGAVAPAAP